jgi:hypothetical protein
VFWAFLIGTVVVLVGIIGRLLRDQPAA